MLTPGPAETVVDPRPAIAGGRAGVLASLRGPGRRPGLGGAALAGIPPLLVGLLAVLQLLVLRGMSHGRYVALSEAANGSVLHWAHVTSKQLVPVLLFALAVTLLRARPGPLLVASHRTRLLLLAVQVCGFLGLALLIPDLPLPVERGAPLGAAQLLSYAIAISAFSAVCLGSIALVASHGFRVRWALAVFAGAWLAQAAPYGGVDWLLGGGREIIEGTTLALSLWFIEAGGWPLPALSYEGAMPILSAPGFAVEIAPLCSGYQGMAGAAVLLGSYVALERRALRMPRALLACAGAIAAVFVLNALRIAVLFQIGTGISPEIAVNGFHSQFGALSLLAISILGIVAMEHPAFRQGGARGETGDLRLPGPDLAQVTVLVLPLALYLLLAMVAGLFAGVFNWFYPLPVLAGALVLWAMRAPLAPLLAWRAPHLAAVPVGVAVYAIWIALIPVDPARTEVLRAALVAAPAWLAALWIGVRVLGSSLLVPLLEELAFRGGLIRLTEGVLPGGIGKGAAAAVALLVSSVAFGLMHAQVLAGTVAGIAFGGLYLWRRALSDAIAAHAVTNFLICVHVLGLGAWSYW